MLDKRFGEKSRAIEEEEKIVRRTALEKTRQYKKVNVFSQFSSIMQPLAEVVAKCEPALVNPLYKVTSLVQLLWSSIDTVY